MKGYVNNVKAEVPFSRVLRFFFFFEISILFLVADLVWQASSAADSIKACRSSQHVRKKPHYNLLFVLDLVVIDHLVMLNVRFESN